MAELSCGGPPGPAENGKGRDALDRKPALAGNQSVAFDAIVLWELDGQISTHVKATGHIAAWFQQREHI